MQLLKDGYWIVTSLLIPIIGFIVVVIVQFKTIKEAIKLLLQNNLMNIFFVYDQSKTIPDYVYKGWLNQFRIYKVLKGNDFVDELKDRMDKFEITHTNILK